MDSDSIKVALIYLLVLAPFILLWIFIFRKLKKYIKKPLAYCFLILFTLIGLALYFGLMADIGDNYFEGDMRHQIGETSVSGVYLCVPVIAVTLAMTIVFLIVQLFSKTKKPEA